MTATHELRSDLSRLADDGCPHHPDADHSTTHPALPAAVAVAGGPIRRGSLLARLLTRLWS